MAGTSKWNRKQVKRDSSCDCPCGGLKKRRPRGDRRKSRAYMAELTEQLEEMESRTVPQMPAVSEGLRDIFRRPAFRSTRPLPACVLFDRN
jgi:hypothetical protein